LLIWAQKKLNCAKKKKGLGLIKSLEKNTLFQCSMIYERVNNALSAVKTPHGLVFVNT
jgi:hypothetical protein